ELPTAHLRSTTRTSTFQHEERHRAPATPAPHIFFLHLLTNSPCRVILHPVTLVENAGRLKEESPAKDIGARSSLKMEDLLQRLTEVCIRQQQIVEHLATRQGRTEEELAAIRAQRAQPVPPPNPRVQATQLLSKMTAFDDVEAFLQLFETTAVREGWAEDDWASALAPLLTGEVQRTYFTLPPRAAADYREVKREILARLRLSLICAAQQFHEWVYKVHVPARAQAAELSRIAQHWLLEGETTAEQVVERVVIDRLLRALPCSQRQAVGMKNPTTILELVEAIELADAMYHREAGERAPLFPRRVVQERRALEGTPRTVSRPTVPSPPDVPMPTAESAPPPRTWLAGCIVHQNPPPAAPAAEVKVNGKPMRALLDSGSAVTLIQSRLCPPQPVQKTFLPIQRIRDRFHWPGMEADVRGFCQACPTCQITTPRTPPPSPLIPLPIIEVPFERIGLDLAGPLPRSARGHEHILVIVDYATRYPEAVPLRKATAKSIAQELFLLASRVGIPAEILTDQGTPFMSRLMADLCRLLRVNQLRTTVYHPQTDGLVERFNQTLKQMLRRVAAEDKRDWDLMIPYVMFGIREVPQASTGFTPFELLFARQPRGLLDVAREAWEQQPAPHRTVVEHVRQMRERIDRIMPLVREHLSKAQQAQQRHYNRAAQPREFQPGDRVMVPVPTSACKFLASWQGPYTVVEKIGPVIYRVRQPGKRQAEQLYHINLLKKWTGTRDQLAALSLTDPVVVDVDPHLSAAQKAELQHLVGQFSDVFSSRPGQTNVIQHDIRTPPRVIVRQQPYRVPEARRQAIEEEVQEMLKLGVIEPSRSPCSSPIVMVPKPDGTLRFCNDFRRLNEVSEFDSYPMPRVDELLDRLGRARYISMLDLTKGYWQVPLTPTAKLKTAFSTPSGHWQYRTLPFGLHGAPATFQRMMDIILRPHQAYAAAYLDDVVVHSEAWEEHLERLRRVFSELRRAGLTANPRKCHLALSEAKYLGFQVGRGLIQPQEKKVEAIRKASQPLTKTQVRAFLGLAGYYRCFIPNFSSLAAPLTDLTRKGQPEKIQWTSAAEKAFVQLKVALTSSPVLRAPDFSCPFLLQMDATDTGLGAVLSQIQEGEEHPVLYISRKLSPAERNYATVEKEALAIKWAVLESRYYLLGRKFTLVTDHAPLQWMARAKETNARVTRWFLTLQDFHFEVRHRAGATNNNADGLSRIWTAYAGLSGAIPHPPHSSPLLSPFISRTRTTLRGGECDEYLRAHQCRPGNQRSSAARRRHKLIGHGCFPIKTCLQKTLKHATESDLDLTHAGRY
ncbi:hypothetical protein M9458_056412, partial [Cirrhinus mrigala]